MFYPSLRAALLAAAIATVGVASALVERAQADIYGFDRGHTNISFSWDHLGLSRQSGRILDYDGMLDFDPAEPEKASVEVTLKAASLSTGVEALDKQLKTSDFFDVERFPLITFKSTGVTKTGEKTGDVTGDLTIMGITKPLTLNVTWNFTGDHPLGAFNANYKDRVVSAFTATAKLLRSDWGVKRGTPIASDEIQLTINTELLKK